MIISPLSALPLLIAEASFSGTSHWSFKRDFSFSELHEDDGLKKGKPVDTFLSPMLDSAFFISQGLPCKATKKTDA
jgi:hypothetical protein